MPTLNERRAADHFIKPAGIAGVYADARGAIGAIDVVGIECDRGLALFCCTAGRQRLIAEKAAARLQAGAGQAAAAVAIRAAAEELRFGLSSHETVIQRAFAAVEAVSRRMAELQKSGGMKEINKLFAAERKAGSTVRYPDFLYARSWRCSRASRGKGDVSDRSTRDGITRREPFARPSKQQLPFPGSHRGESLFATSTGSRARGL